MTDQYAANSQENPTIAPGLSQGPASARAPLLLSRVGIVLVAVLGIGMSALLHGWLVRDESEHLAHEVEDHAQVQAALLELQLTRFVDRVVGSVRLFLASERVTSEEFAAFNGVAGDDFPAASGFAWAPRVAPEARAALETALRSDSESEAIWALDAASGERVSSEHPGERYPLRYLVSPLIPSRPIGFDVASTEAGRALLARAQAAGKPYASGLVRPRMLPGQPLGVVVAAPVNKPEDGGPATLTGFVLGFVATDALVVESAGHSAAGGIDYLLADAGDRDVAPLASQPEDLSHRVAALRARPFSAQAPVRLANSELALLAAPTPAYIASHRTIKPWGGLALGLMLTTVMVFWLRSARRRAELMRRQVALQGQTLQMREAEFAATFSESPLGMSIASPDGRVMRANARLCRLLGRTAEELIGHSYTEFTHPDDVGNSQAALRGLALGGREGCSVTKRYVRPGGEVVWAKVAISPIRDQSGALRCVVGLMEDITERRKLQLELEEAEARWRFALEGADHGVWDWDARTQKVFYSSRWKDMLGYADDEIGDGFGEWESRVHPDDLPGIRAALDAHFKGETSIYLSEHRLRCKDGHYAWVLDRGKVVEWADDGSPLRVIGTHTDISATRALILQAQMRVRVIEAVSAGRPLRQVLTIMIEAIEAYMSDWLCSVLLLDDDGMHLRHGAAAHLPGAYVAAIDGVAIGPAVGSCGTAVYHNRRVISADLSLDPAWAPYLPLARSAGLASCWSEPIRDPAGRAVGSFAVYHRTVCAPTSLDLEFMEAATQLAALAIERSREAEDLARHRSMLSALSTLQREFIDSPQSDTAHAQLLELACTLTDSPIGFIADVDVDSIGQPVLRPHAIRQAGVATTGMTELALSQDLTYAVLADGATYISNDPPRETGCAMLWPGAPTPSAFIGLPVHSGGRLVGLLGLVNRTGGYETDWRDRLAPLVSTLAAIIAASRMQAGQLAALRAQASAEAASKAKSQFLANVSHELRTPMNAIIGLTALCLKTPLDERQTDYLHKVADAARGLMDVISDVLDFSRIEADRLELDSLPFTLERLVARVTACFEERSRDKGIDLSTRIDPRIPAVLRGDKVRLAQVLINLVGNAVKFTDAGTVALEIEQVSAGAEAVRLRFAVRDTGIGIRVEVFERLFDPFEQADVSTTRQYGGTGLGLSISQRLVMLMGGRIVVSSAVGKGSEFSFEIDLPVVQGDAATEATRLEAAEPLAGHTVLVIEDQPLNRQVVAELLESEGADVRLAGDGEAGLGLLDGVDLVLTDIQMPGIDGYETARRIRADPAHRALPVIALTAHALSDERARCEAAGMDDLITKPVDPALMLKVIGRWLAHGRGAPSVDLTADAAPAMADTGGGGLDLRAGLRYARNKPDFYRRLLNRFASDEANAASKLRQLFADGDLAGAERLAHSIKGMAGTLGAQVLREVAADLEHRIREQGEAVDPACAEELVQPMAEVIAHIERIEADPSEVEALARQPA